jgi:peptidoglycan/LPS O-acetylase OafA/YrhL
MKYLNVINKLEPRHFSSGAGFNADAFASLKEAFPVRRHNRIVLSAMAVVLLTVCGIFAATISALPFIPAWLLYIVLALLLRTRKWNNQVKTAKETLGISEKEIKMALKKVEDENKYIPAGARMWFFTALLLAFIIYAMSINTLSHTTGRQPIAVYVDTFSALFGMFGIFLCLRLKTKYLWPVFISVLLPVVCGAVLIIFQTGGDKYVIFRSSTAVVTFHLTACIFMLTACSYRKRLKRYGMMLWNKKETK